MARTTRILLIYNEDFLVGEGSAPGDEARAGVLKTAKAAEAALRKMKSIDLTVAGVAKMDDLVKVLDRSGPFDVALNLIESLRGDARYEIPVPVLLQSRGIDYTGNVPVSLRLCLDKGQARGALGAAGVPISAGGTIASMEQLRAAQLPIPAMVKPAREDGSIGIEESSVAWDRAALEKRVRFILEEMKQPAIVEGFIEGREFNVSVFGDEEPRCLPIAEIDFSGMPAGIPKIVSYKAKWHESTPEYKGTVPVFGSTDEALARRLRKAALGAFRALSLRDYARVDMRVDAQGNPFVIDVNPNCDLAPDAGFPRAAAKDGIDYDALIQTLVGFAMARRSRRAGRGKPTPPAPAPRASTKARSKAPKKKTRSRRKESRSA